MSDQKSAKSIEVFVSPYLRQPLRSFEQAQDDRKRRRYQVVADEAETPRRVDRFPWPERKIQNQIQMNSLQSAGTALLLKRPALQEHGASQIRQTSVQLRGTATEVRTVTSYAAPGKGWTSLKPSNVASAKLPRIS